MRNLLAVLFLAIRLSTLQAAEYTGPVLQAVDREEAMKGSRTGQFFVEKALRFQAGEFVYRRAYTKENGEPKYVTSSRLGFRRTGGHAGELTLGYPGAQPWPAAESCWLTTGAEGSSVAQLAVPVIKDGRRIGGYALRFVELPEQPGWLFLRLTFDGNAPRASSWDFDGGWTEFDPKYNKKGNAVRWLHVQGIAYPGSDTQTVLEAGSTFAFGLYAVGSQKFDDTSTVLVGRLPEAGRATLGFRGRQLFRLSWTLPAEARELSFAIRNLDDRPGKESVEEYFKSDSTPKMLALLKTLDWEPHPPVVAPGDLPPAEQAKLKKLFADKDYNGYFNLLSSLTTTQNRAIASELESLLE